MKRLWTFLVLHGEPFRLEVKGNPAAVHDGTRSIVSCLCTEEQAKALETEMKAYGCQVTSNSPEESAEQRAEREHVMAMMGDGQAFPCEKCPGCSWFDPSVQGLCGAGMLARVEAQGWEPQVIEDRLSDPKFREDWDACPLKNPHLN